MEAYLHKEFLIIWLSNLSILNVHDVYPEKTTDLQEIADKV